MSQFHDGDREESKIFSGKTSGDIRDCLMGILSFALGRNQDAGIENEAHSVSPRMEDSEVRDVR